MNNVAVFCPCPKYSSEAKLKNYVVIALAEEFFRKPPIDYVGSPGET